MNRFHHPEGNRLPALEKNILKYRAFEMMLVLFNVEYFKEIIVGSIQASGRIEANIRNKFKMATATLVADGILTSEENEELRKLVNFRNDIGHRIHELTFDVSRTVFARQTREILEAKYDYNALNRIKYYLEEIPDRMAKDGRYIFELSMNSLLFESAEKTYNSELRRLHRKIEAQYAQRRKRNGILKSELSLQGTGLTGHYSPAHPANQTRNEKLTKRGAEICHRLFDVGKRPLVVAHLMHISLKSTRRRYKAWIKAGGANRTRLPLQ